MHCALSFPPESAVRNSMFLVLVLALSGCTRPDAASTPNAADTPAKIPAASPVVVSGVSASEPSHASEKFSTPSPATKLALDGEGLRIFAVPTGTSRAIPFGLGKAETLAVLATLQGAPPSRQGENIDCGATNATWPDGLTVWFARGKFVGWSVGSASSLATAGGLRVGATRSDVENGAIVARIAPSSLGEEFTAGDIAGLLDSTDANARVTHLWAGAACVAR